MSSKKAGLLMASVSLAWGSSYLLMKVGEQSQSEGSIVDAIGILSVEGFIGTTDGPLFFGCADRGAMETELYYQAKE